MLKIESGDEITDFQIEVVDDPTDTRKLSDYLKTGLYESAQMRLEGVMLASKFKLTSDFTFPKGKIKIRTTGLTKTREFIFPVPDNMKMLSPDKLDMELSTSSSSPSALLISVNDESFRGELKVKMEGGVPVMTPHADFYDLFRNLDFKYTVLGDCAEFLKVEKTAEHLGAAWMTFMVTDAAKLKAKVGEFLPAENSRPLELKLRVTFPNELAEPIDITTTIQMTR